MTLLYGIMIMFVLGGSAALSMAEIASVYPTAGGQYHWTSILAPDKFSRGLSYWCGILNTFGWIASIAGFIVTFPSIILALVSFWHPGYILQSWHAFLIFQTLNLLFTAYNIFLLKRSAWVMKVGFFMSIIAFFVITTTCLAESNPKGTNVAVWNRFENTSGWSSDAIVFFSGLVNPNFIYSGLDGAVHLAEECANAAVVVPRALISTVIIGFITAFGFAVAMCYSYHEFDTVLASTFPALEVFYQATLSKQVATFFAITIAIINLFAITGAQQTASRLVYSFARDDAVVLSSYLSRIHARWDVPVPALLFNGFCVFLLGCINLGSTSAFNALVSTGMILSQLSYAFPAVLMLYHRALGTMDKVMPVDQIRFRLPFGVGPIANILTIVLALLGLVFYDFPTVVPVTAANMNYASAVIGVMALVAIANWFWYARNCYHGPRLGGVH